MVRPGEDLLRPQIILFALFAALATSCTCVAQRTGSPGLSPQMEIPWPEWWTDMPPPGPLDVLPLVPDAGSAQPVAVRPATLLDIVTSWLAANFGLPTAGERPRVELVPRIRLAALRYRGLVSDRPGQVPSGDKAGPLGDLHAVHAVYNDERRTIYLPEDWEGETPAEVSVLLHELVHHLQNVTGLKFSCPQERERLAYDAQARWLAMFGRTLDAELGIDAFDALIRTRCFN